MKSLRMILFLCIILALIACSCEKEKKTCTCPPFSIIPISPFDDPIWHPSGNIIGFNHRPIKEINYTYGYHCPQQAEYTYAEDSAGFWLVNTDGTNKRRILPYFLQTPTWSPDGRWIAFVEGAQIFKMPFDGEKFDTTNIIQLTFEGRNYFPAWSPNGEWIAYDSDVNSENGLSFIWKMTNNGTEKTRIAYTPEKGETRMPNWCINGLIVHQRHIGIGSTEIFTMKDSGDSAIRKTGNENTESYPKYSTTCENIAFISQSSSTGKVGLWMIKANVSNNKEHLLASEAQNFSWSPDGKNIVYLHHNDYRIDKTKGTLWIVNIETNNKRQLTFNNPYIVQ